MPLHDWATTSGWEGVHLLWMTELVRHLKGRLPAGFRAYLGTVPVIAVGEPAVRRDVSVRSEASLRPTATGDGMEPDVEVAVATLDPEPALHVAYAGRLVAAVELVSPRNKDRAVARATYARRYAGYLMEGVNLLVVDVHPRPAGFSFADQVAAELELAGQAALPAPFAISYRVGEPAATGGRLLAMWRRGLEVGAALPAIPLPLGVGLDVAIDLESTYMRAAADAYLA